MDSKDSYPWIYKLKPVRESIDDPGWWKLRWRPIKNGTYNLYTFRSKNWNTKLLGLRFYPAGAHNGWNRSWSGFTLEIGFVFFTVHFWLRWNISVHKDGPGDGGEPIPLDLGGLT